MRFASVVVVVVVVVVAVVGVNGDDCGPPNPGEKHAHPPECCKLDGVGGMISASMKSGAMKCQDKFPRPPRPPGPPPSGAPPTPSPEMKKNHACMAECVFTEAGIVKDGKLDKAAIMKGFTSDNKELSDVIAAAVDKCFATYEKDVDTSLECKSGAAEMEKCVMREIFLACPSSVWTNSAECTALKTKVGKCPQMPMMMMRGPHGPRGPRPN